MRLRVPVAAPGAEPGRDVLTDIDVLSVDVDLRLRVSRGSLECKSSRGQSGEPVTLIWLAGFRQLLRLSRVTFVRPTVSGRGRALAKRLAISLLDEQRLAAREAASQWLPDRFAHIDGEVATAAEARTDVQLRGLPDLPASVSQFLRYESMLAESPALLAAVEAFGRGAHAQGGLPEPTSSVLSAHALMAVLFAAVQDAGRLGEISPAELKARLQRALATGDPDDDHILPLLERADALVRYTVERVHRSYTDAGAEPIAFEPPSLRDAVAAPLTYLDDYLDLVERIRANPTVSRDLLQTAELACFEYLLGGTAWQSPAFAHLLSAEHRGLLLVALRVTARIAGQQVADALSALQHMPVTAVAVPDRRGTNGTTPESAQRRTDVIREGPSRTTGGSSGAAEHVDSSTQLPGMELGS